MLRARVGSSMREESLQHLGLPPQSVDQHPGPTTAVPATEEAPAGRVEEGSETATQAAAPAAPPATASAGTPREEIRQKLRKRGQLTPRETTSSATAGGGTGKPEEVPASLINFKLDQVLPDPERRCEATWQLKRPIEDLPAKLSQLFKRRQWVPLLRPDGKQETRRPRMRDAVLIQRQGTYFGKAGRIVQDDGTKLGAFKVQLVEGEDPFGEVQGELQELRAKIVKNKGAIGRTQDPAEQASLNAEQQKLLRRQSVLQSPVPGSFRASELTLLDEEHVSRFALAGPNAHCVGSIVVDCKGEESEGSFTRACVKLKKDLASSAPPQGAEQVALAPQDEARYRNERLRAQSDFLLAVVQLSSFWMPFDASAFTLEAEAAEEEVVAAETRTLT